MSSVRAVTAGPKLLLVDGHAYAYRSFHAIRSLSSPAGTPTNAIYGFVKTLQKMRTQLEPSHLAVVWDGGLSAERLAILPAYKAQRAPMPAALEAQIEDLQAWLEASGLASFCQAGVEADDGIAALARGAQAQGAQVVIASSDKDFMQLVGPGIGLLNPNDKSEAVWGADQVRAKTGVAPSQVVDWLSLVGDAVDNIPGVPGVGPKTAAGLLRDHGSLEGLLNHLDAVETPRLRATLQEAGPVLERNREMIRLKEDWPREIHLDDLAPRRPDYARLRELYSRWGFRSLLNALPGGQPEVGDLFDSPIAPATGPGK